MDMMEKETETKEMKEKEVCSEVGMKEATAEEAETEAGNFEMEIDPKAGTDSGRTVKDSEEETDPKAETDSNTRELRKYSNAQS